MAVSVSPSWQGIKDMVNIRGWYQSAGDGTFYYVNTQTVAGQKIEVLTQGAGAQAWTDTHWFRSLPLAKANASAHFDSDIDRPTDWIGIAERERQLLRNSAVIADALFYGVTSLFVALAPA